MDTLKTYLEDIPFVSDLKNSIPKKRKIYLVGGFLRDFFLNRKSKRCDLDFAVDKNAISQARSFAKKIKAGFVVLDKEHGCARVVKFKDNKAYTFDFADFRCKDIKKDLLKRDFTINALALDLADLKKFPKLESRIIDPALGLRDLKRKIIKATSNKSFKDDSLRIMRAFSLSAELEFEIDNKTLALIKKEKKSLADSAFERIRDELFKILDTSDSHSIIKKLDSLKILELILPEIKVMQNIEQGPYHHLDVWGHSKEALKKLEQFLAELEKNEDISDYLNQALTASRRRHQLLKLGVLLHDIGKPDAMHVEGEKLTFHGHERLGLMFAKSIAERLKLSNIEEGALRLMILWHLRPGYLSDIKILSPRAKFRFFRDARDEAVSILLISLADQRATRGPLTKHKDRKHHEQMIGDLINEYFRLKKQKPFKRLIDGKDLIKKLKLKPGVMFGKILKEAEEYQATGKIKTKTEALELAKKIVGRGKRR